MRKTNTSGILSEMIKAAHNCLEAEDSVEWAKKEFNRVKGSDQTATILSFRTANSSIDDEC